MSNDTQETREFSTAAIASISTGKLLCEFGKMHEAAEYLMGHPIWTHQFASEQFWARMRQAVLEQRPCFPIAMSGVTRENYQDHVAALEREHGATVTIRKGDGHAAMNPLEGLPEGKPTVLVVDDLMNDGKPVVVVRT
jgi:hypothetical protein